MNIINLLFLILVAFTGPNQCYDDGPDDNMFTNGKLFTSNVATSLDLNRIQLDESSTQSNNTLLGYTSAASSSGTSGFW